MLLKYSQYQKRTKLPSGMPQRPTGNSKMLNGKGKGHRKGIRCAASKKLNHKLIASKKEEVRSTTVDPCDNSNDSGLGFDHHIEYQMPSRTGFVDQEYCWGTTDPKRQRLDIKLESDNANDDFTFPPSRIADPTSTEMPICLRAKPPSPGKMAGVHTGTQQGLSKNGRVQLQILSQPEMQHRARYQTEGSRGAVKDRSGNGFPVVRLVGFNKAATLEVYIGTDQGRVAPHMFYQACRVSGKNSTPCLEKKLNGTVLIEMQLDPTKEMTVTCDCVGILKERNVDVEHRFPDENPGRSKKKSTRCRMVFRTVVTLEDGSLETLQVTSQPIVCTQPPGVPEILKKSLTSVPADGGQEMFILGKNFLKDSRVTFSQGEPGTDNYWEAVVQPDKEYLQQSHMVCVVPPYRDDSIGEAVAVRLTVTSGGRSSELHPFFYTPKAVVIGEMTEGHASRLPTGIMGASGPHFRFRLRGQERSWPQLMGPVHLSPSAFPAEVSSTNRAQAQGLIPTSVYPTPNVLVGVQWHLPVAATPSSTFVTDVPPVAPIANPTCDEVEMPPPTGLPPSRRGSDGKREAKSPNSSVGSGAGGSSLAATFQQFVSLPPVTLPSLSLEGYFPTIEAKQLPSSSQLPSSGVKAETAPPILLDLHVSPPPPPPPAQQVILETKLEELMPQTAAELLYPTATEVSVTTPSPVLTTAEFQAALLAPVAAVAGVFPGDFVAASPSGTAPPPTFMASFESPAQGPAPTSAPSVQLLEPVVEPPSVLPSQDAAPTDGEPPQKKCEEGIPLPQELTQMSETDLLSYINPSCFDQV